MAIFVLIAFSAVTLYVKTRHLPFARIKSFLLAKRKTDPRVFAAVFVFALGQDHLEQGIIYSGLKG